MPSHPERVRRNYPHKERPPEPEPPRPPPQQDRPRHLDVRVQRQPLPPRLLAQPAAQLHAQRPINLLGDTRQTPGIRRRDVRRLLKPTQRLTPRR